MLTNHQEADEFFAQTRRPLLLLGVLALVVATNITAGALSLLAA